MKHQHKNKKKEAPRIKKHAAHVKIIEKKPQTKKELKSNKFSKKLVCCK